MSVFVGLLGCIGAVILIAAAFMYVFDPGQALKSLKKALLLLLGVSLSLELLVVLAHRVGACCMTIFLLLVSLGAYEVREKLFRRPERSRKPGKAERKPILPGGG